MPARETGTFSKACPVVAGPLAFCNRPSPTGTTRPVGIGRARAPSPGGDPCYGPRHARIRGLCLAVGDPARRAPRIGHLRGPGQALQELMKPSLFEIKGITALHACYAPLPRPAPGRRRLLAGALALALALPAAATEAQTDTQTDWAATQAGAAEGPVTEEALAAPAATPLPRPAPEPVDPAAARDRFAMPRVTRATALALARLQAGDAEGAAADLDALIARHPTLGFLQANRAALAMLAGDAEGALDRLEAAAARGFAGLEGLAADPLFAPLAADPAFGARLAALATAAPPPPAAPVPAPVVDGTAMVTATATTWNPASARLETAFAFPPEPAGPVMPKGRRDPARDLLREHVARGRASGNHGDLYDNRDRGHSSLAAQTFPQLARVAYPPEAQASDLDYGLNDRILFAHPTLGNSSTALTAGPTWRSQPRLALTEPDGTGPLRLWQNAAANHLYVYPAHKDFTEEGGDLLPANTPYILVSRGSSFSDQPFLEAVAMIYAAFRPATKARLVETGTLVSTTQMVFRRSLQAVTSSALYHSAAAHPAAHAGFQINLARMVSLAQSIAPEAIPAEARLRVVEEAPATEGIDFFGEGLSEVLFDTPSAIARVWRAGAGRREIILSAEDSRDVNDRALTYQWHLLQGDPDRVTIEPLEGGARARITLDWHEPFAISEDDPITTRRVDIGLFAHNGAHDSAPAIASWYFPDHETRVYAPGPDGAPRLMVRDGADPARADAYADPMLVARTPWRDEYSYDADGALAGWTRHRAEGPPAEYTAQGARILARHPDGSPARAETVRHALARDRDGGLTVEELSTGLLADLPPGAQP